MLVCMFCALTGHVVLLARVTTLSYVDEWQCPEVAWHAWFAEDLDG